MNQKQYNTFERLIEQYTQEGRRVVAREDRGYVIAELRARNGEREFTEALCLINENGTITEDHGIS